MVLWYHINMIIREARESDNAKDIAKLIYETDIYIYPYWFKDKDDGIEHISQLVKNRDCIFYHKNYIVAEIDGKIIGLLMYVKNDGSYTYGYEDFKSLSFQSNHVINNFVLEIQNAIVFNTYTIFAVRVADNYTRRGIAYNMFQYMFNKIPKNSNIDIEVLKDNIPAINLYKKAGFKITKEYKGYNGYRKKKPLCYCMKKYKT